MATANKKLKVCALILMIFLSLGYAFYLSFHPNFTVKKNNFPSEVHEILSLEEARTTYEKQVEQSIQTMLNSWFGENKSKVSVRAEMDFSEQSQTKEILDRDNPVLSKTIGDNVEYSYAKEVLSNSQKTGKIKHLSVAVLIDTAETNLAKETLQDLRRLIERTAGFDFKRGDTLEIVETRFAPMPFFTETVWSHSLFIFTIILLFVLFGVIMTKNAMKAEQIEPPPSILPAFTNPDSYAIESTDKIQKPNALKKVHELLQKNPDETVTLLRGWMCQTEEIND